MKRIVVVGGKGGISRVLLGLKELRVDLTAVISTFDSGGSTGKIREEFGGIAWGDLRGTLSTLSPDPELSKLFESRLPDGHCFGNLFLQGLNITRGSEIKAIEESRKFLGVKSKVLPISLDSSHLHATLANGHSVKGETNIDVPKHDANLKIKKISLKPAAKIYPGAEQAILNADYIILGPGDLYTSILPNILVRGFTQALKKSRAKIIYLPNLYNKFGETNDFKASDFAVEILKYTKLPRLDYIICNSKSLGVKIDLENLKALADNVIIDDIVSDRAHDPQKLKKILIKTLNT